MCWNMCVLHAANSHVLACAKTHVCRVDRLKPKQDYRRKHVSLLGKCLDALVAALTGPQGHQSSLFVGLDLQPVKHPQGNVANIVWKESGVP